MQQISEQERLKDERLERTKYQKKLTTSAVTLPSTPAHLDKKVKLFAEAAALGIVAVGAGLFSILVASTTNFLSSIYNFILSDLKPWENLHTHRFAK
jgi:hypothetical protein